MGEIRTGFLAPSPTSFNFSTPGCDFKNNLRIATCRMSPWGRKRAWELVPVVTCSIGLARLREDAGLNVGDLRPPPPPGLSVLVMSSLPRRSVSLILLSISWLSRTACCPDRAGLSKPIKGGRDLAWLSSGLACMPAPRCREAPSLAHPLAARGLALTTAFPGLKLSSVKEYLKISIVK